MSLEFPRAEMAAEPMMIGSPPYSPIGASQAQLANYSLLERQNVQNTTLPPYLMGETLPMSPSVGRKPSISPSKSMLNRSHAGHLSQGHQSGLYPSDSGSPPRTLHRKDRIGGPPPTQGLFESFIGNPDKSRVVDSDNPWNMSYHPPAADNSMFGNTFDTSVVFDPNLSVNNSQFAPGFKSNSSYLTDFGKESDNIADCWITVFGFQPAAASYILQQFTQYGNIMHHSVPTDGNWMHLHFRSKMQAKRALSKSGKIFCSNMMVGVVPCTDESVMERFAEASTDPRTAELKQQEMLAQGPPVNNSLLEMSGSRGNIRSLTAGYQRPSHNNPLSNMSISSPPEKRNGLVSKAMEYVFGW